MPYDLIYNKIELTKKEEDMKHEIKVCMGSSCFARGNMNNLEYIENYLKNNNLEAEIDLVGAHCQNLCENGPHIFVDGKNYDEVTEDKLQKILEELQ